MNLLLYTVLIGNKDPVPKPLPKRRGLTQVLVVDEERSFQVPDKDVFERWTWVLTPRTLEEKHWRKSSRRHKLLTHMMASGHDVSCYVDANMYPKDDPSDWIEANFEDWFDFMAFKHPERTMARQELAACRSIYPKLKAEYDAIEEDSDDPIGSNFPLLAGGVLLRRSDPSWLIEQAFKWREKILVCERDQLSLPWSLEDYADRVGIIDDNIFTQKVFPYRRHVR